MTDTPSSADHLARNCADVMWADDNASQWLGMQIDAMAEGRAVLSMSVKSTMVNGHDICHGGFIFSLADSAFAFACNSHNQVAVAANCSIDFIRPAHTGDRLTATAAQVHQGGRTGIYDIAVCNQTGDIIAQMRGRSARTKAQLINEHSE